MKVVQKVVGEGVTSELPIIKLCNKAWNEKRWH